MTPLEINIRIAELKGLNCEHDPSVERDKMAYLHIVDTPDSEYDPSYYFNWAENISDAWELFEEMPEPSIFKVDSKILKKEYSNLIYSVSCKEFGMESIHAETAPLAIALAYIKWKTK